MIPNQSLFPADMEIIASYKQAQEDIDKPAGHIIYKTDDLSGIYEIYRISEKPDSWSDFVDSPTLATAEINSAIQSGLDDTINKNTDYYYFARMRDAHGNISNPTSVLHLRIVKEEGFPPYMVLKPYYFPKKKDKITTERTFKKYLKVRFDDLHSVDGDDAKTAVISYKPKKGDIIKKYKIRVTSKKTGKKIDVNLQMKNKIIDKFGPTEEAKEEGANKNAPVDKGD